MSCGICGARSHNDKKCPRAPKTTVTEKNSTGGRGLTKRNKNDLAALGKCLEKLDVEALYDTGAKSLVGGRKGKPSGLSDTSYRIDRQAKGNVQFQKGGVSLAKVAFGPDVNIGCNHPRLAPFGTDGRGSRTAINTLRMHV